MRTPKSLLQHAHSTLPPSSILSASPVEDEAGQKELVEECHAGETLGSRRNSVSTWSRSRMSRGGSDQDGRRSSVLLELLLRRELLVSQERSGAVEWEYCLYAY